MRQILQNETDVFYKRQQVLQSLRNVYYKLPQVLFSFDPSYPISNNVK